ncbi:MAG: alcohol dehydrogenase family protein [Marinobacterium sp.]|nr:alcohol dehydrogenase family protein [Marinobacterium sp.]
MQTLPEYMSAMVLTGHGGLEKLEYRENVPVPQPAADEVLIKVGAAALNNTDINTRIGWYSRAVTGQTAEGALDGCTTAQAEDATWAGQPLQFPRIQGADCCGEVIAVGAQVSTERLGQRVLVRPMHPQTALADPFCFVTWGSECDGGFAQYARVRADQAFSIDSALSDIELASFPCAYSTAENMLARADVKAGDRVLVTGASGGVGSAAVQLVRRRGASVVAVCGRAKRTEVQALGAEVVFSREDDLLQELGAESIDVVIDLVAGDRWSVLLDLLCRGGRYAVAGAIAGPLVELDVRTLYLKDLSFFGCTWQPPEVFENLIRYIEAGEIEPLVVQSWPLSQLRDAQQRFLSKDFVGKLVVVP